MKRSALLAGLLAAALLPTVAVAQEGAPPPPGVQGANGIGDPYFPLDGNGGYDVGHYGLELDFDPATDVLSGVATINLLTTQRLSRFNLDFDGMTVDSVTVDGQTATFQRGNGELKITPPGGVLPRGQRTEVVVTYHGIPRDLPAAEGGGGWLDTDDGVLTVGQPHVASYWFPVNDHPADKARFTFGVTVPAGLEAVANGRLISQEPSGGGTRWLWQARAPMAPYLATVDVGEFDLDQYHAPGGRPGGIAYLDAVDPDLFDPIEPRTGTQYAFSQVANSTYKRLSRTIAVPPGGATLSFWINRDTEADWDHVAVEARTASMDDWTTLPDTNGHTSTSTASSCPTWLQLHPFLSRYQTAQGPGCAPTGSSGSWNAASGTSDGWEQWSVDLGEFADSTVEVSISYISDDTVQSTGVLVDDIVVSTGEGSTSFEDDGNELDGWTVPGAPAGSPANANDWIVGTTADGPPPLGENVQASLDRQAEIIRFLARRFGNYPFADAGAIVDDLRDVGFALENQTRPVYAPEFFVDPLEGDAVVVHELAHQWFGDRIAVPRWQHIWLSEGFATYAEWLWSGSEGTGTPQEIFDFFMGIPASDPFWDVTIGDPGPAGLFHEAVYFRGAMTLQALRNEVGLDVFYAIVRRWAARPPSRPATTRAFRTLAEEVSGEPLGALFREWLHTPAKPSLTEAGEAASGPPATRVPMRTHRPAPGG